MSSPNPVLREHVLLSPDGANFVVTEEVFEGFRRFLGEKRSGSLTIHFARGGIAKVEEHAVIYPKDTQAKTS